MVMKKVEDFWECDGMCFPQHLVLNDIFSLQGVVESTNMSLGNDSQSEVYYLQEVTRLISTISVYSRNQLTSYFHSVDSSLSKKEKLAEIQQKNIGANNAIFSVVGVLICPKKGHVPVTFYDMISKFCHVEKWRYPRAFFTPHTYDEGDNKFYLNLEKLDLISIGDKELGDDYYETSNVLEIEVTKRNKDIGCGQVETYRILPWQFANSARVFITDCESCQLVEAEPDAVCATK